MCVCVCVYFTVFGSRVFYAGTPQTFDQDYSTEGLTRGQLLFIQHLRQFGLVYQRRVSSLRTDKLTGSTCVLCECFLRGRSYAKQMWLPSLGSRNRK